MGVEEARVWDLDDVDEVRAGLEQGLFPMSLDLVRPRTAPAFRFRGRLNRTGPLSVGSASYTAALRIGIPTVDSVYYINMPGARSSMSADGRGGPITVSSGQGLLLTPGDSSRIGTSDDYRSHAVMIDRDALERQLSAVIGKPVTGPIRFAPQANLATGAGASWARMVRWFTTEANSRVSMLGDPLIAEPLHEALLIGLLAAGEHPYLQAMANRQGSAGPTHVRLAMDEVNDHAAEPLTAARLAEAAGVSIRTLQVGFRRHLDTTPLGYLRQVRLARAHEELRHADPERTTVTSIALKWGFTNVGRFAQEYAQRYGRYPSETLGSR